MSPCPDALSRWPAMRQSDMSRTPQVEGHRIFKRRFFRGQAEQSRRIAEILETRQAPRLRFIRVDRQRLVVASAGMGNVIDAAAERAAAPAIENVEGERGVDIDGRVQRRRQLPRLEAHAGDVFAGAAGCRQRNEPSVAGDGVAAGIKPSTFTCSRSTEESTKRAVTPAVASSPSTCQGSSACRNSSLTPPWVTAPYNGKRNSRWA